MESKSNTTERVICAAIAFPQIELVSHVYRVKNMGMKLVLCGHRHPHIIGQFVTLTGKPLHSTEYIQGFLTSKNNFITRIDAMKMCIENGQIPEGQETYSKDELFSEDLY